MISTLWIQDLKDQELRDHFTKTVMNSSNDVVLMKLKKIIKTKIESLEHAERNIKVYDIPNWSYLQADSNGTLRTLKLIETLLDHVKDS